MHIYEGRTCFDYVYMDEVAYVGRMVIDSFCIFFTLYKFSVARFSFSSSVKQHTKKTNSRL